MSFITSNTCKSNNQKCTNPRESGCNFCNCEEHKKSTY